MNKIIIAIVIAAVGVGVYVFLSGNNTSQDAQNNAEVTERENQEKATNRDLAQESLSGDGSIFDLLQLGRSIRCEVSYTPEEFEGVVNGTVYIANNNVRADMSMESEEGIMQTTFIQTGDQGYAWGSTPFGEMAVTFDIEEDEAFDPQSQSYGETFDVDQDVTYDCEAWNTDQSVFEPPSDVNFVNFQEQIESQMETAGMGDMCSNCERIPDAEAKAQCLQTFSCN